MEIKQPLKLKKSMILSAVRKGKSDPVPSITIPLCFFQSVWMEASPSYSYSGEGQDPMVHFQYTLRGMGCLKIGNQSYDLPEGSLFMLILPDRHRHFLPPGKKWEFLCVTIWGRLAVDLMRSLLFRTGHVVKLDPSAPPIQAMWDLHASAVEGKLKDDYENTLACYQFFVRITRYFSQKFSSRSAITKEQALEVAADSIRSPNFGVSEWAEKVGFSRSYFTRWLQAESGMSPARYLKLVRLQEAARLLQTTDLPLADIASQIGLSGPQVLCRMIVSQYGLKPSALRRLGKGLTQPI